MFEDFGDHWPFLATALVIATIVQALKRVIPDGSKHQRWFRPLLPIIPLLLGASAGFIVGMPMPLDDSTRTTIVLYYTMSGVASTWVFDVVKKLLAARGIDVDSLRPSTRPPAIPVPPAVKSFDELDR